MHTMIPTMRKGRFLLRMLTLRWHQRRVMHSICRPIFTLRWAIGTRSSHRISNLLMNRMHEYSDGLTTSSAKSYRILMEANYRTDRKDWDPASISLTTDVSDLNIEMKAVDSYTKAMIAYAQNDMDVVQALRDSLAKE